MKSQIKFLIAALLSMCLCHGLIGQVYKSEQPLAHTYSIVAYDEATGEMGVAVQSHWFQVGPLVAWGEAGVGVVATQSFVNPAHGPNGLKLMSMGVSADKALELLIGEDEGRDVRQVAFLDAHGNTAAHTGSQCVQAAGHFEGRHYSVQANLMTNDKVWPAMSTAFENSSGPLAVRLIEALKAAEEAGGDIRGKQSAALLVVSGKNTGRPWIDRLVDLRVDDHADPLGELERLYLIHTAYKYMNDGDLAIEKNEMDAAMTAYGKAMKLNPDNEEMKYWYAVSLTNIGHLQDALPLFKSVFDKNENWRILTPRLVDNGLLVVDEDQLSEIIKQ
jgi:uncharacterized Ntn-hydrolase superfamily protein